MKNRKRSTSTKPKQRDEQFLASMARLTNAGILGPVAHDAATGRGNLSFSPEYHRLLMAGRRPMSEPAFLEVLKSADPAKVRAWVAAEADRLDQPMQGDPDESSS